MVKLGGDDFISPSEVAKVVRRLPRRKAAGYDDLPIAAIHQLPRRGITAVTMLFNGILRTGHFPDTWKRAKVIVLPKPGKDRRRADAYRPISLLPHLAKLFERLLLWRIKPFIKPRAEQFGFRSHHSTTLQLTRVLHHLALGMNTKKYSVAVFLDVEKAFDRVWHEGLLYKLTKTEMPQQYISIIAASLRERSFYVTVENKDSSIKKIEAGVPQGSCLSPALYALYTDDIPTLADHTRAGDSDVTLALFADDSAYIATSISPRGATMKIQKVLNLLPEWLNKWKIVVNVGKTAALLVSRNTRDPQKLQLQGQSIEWRSSVRYLGVEIDKRLTMNAQVEQVVRAARTARAMLRPVLYSKLQLRTKLGIYKTYIRSRLTYAAPAWYQLCSATNKKLLQTQQNTALRIIVGAGRYVRNTTIVKDIKMETVKDFVVRLSRKMFDAADNGPHTHLHGLAPLHARPPDETKTWRALPRELLLSDDTDVSGDK